MNTIGISLGLLTAITAVGGFPRPPDFWIKASDNILVQIFAVWILVTQATQFTSYNVISSLVVAIIIVLAIYGVRWLEGSWPEKKKIKGNSIEGYYNPRFFDKSVPTIVNNKEHSEHYTI